MSLWENLPVFVGANLISNWITKNDRHKLDITCCSKGSRTAYLSYCANATCNNHVELYNNSMVTWFLTRRIKISSIRITRLLTSLGDIESIDKLLELNATWISELEVAFSFPNSINSYLSMKIAYLCDNIKSLALTDSCPDHIITLFFQNFTKLTSLTLNCCSLKQEHSNILKERKYKLTNLSLYNANRVAIDTFLDTSIFCYNELQYLEITGDRITELEINEFIKCGNSLKSLTINIADESTIKEIIKNCQYLTSLKLLLMPQDDEYNITDNDLIKILTKYPELSVLELSYCYELTNKSLSKISNFTELKLEHCEDLNSTNVIKLIQRNPQLTHLNLNYCKNINVKTIFKIFDHAKNLTHFVMYSMMEYYDTHEMTHAIMVQALQLRYPNLKHISIYV